MPTSRRVRAVLAARLYAAPDATLAVPSLVRVSRRERAVATIGLGATPDARVRVRGVTMTFVRRKRAGVSVVGLIAVRALGGLGHDGIYLKAGKDGIDHPSPLTFTGPCLIRRTSLRTSTGSSCSGSGCSLVRPERRSRRRRSRCREPRHSLGSSCCT